MTLSPWNHILAAYRACDLPFELVGSGCFYFSDNLAMGWDSARTFCKSLAAGADLAVVADCNLMHLLWNHILAAYNGSNHWIGATDQHEEGMWVWVDGTAVTMGTPFWKYEEPNNLHEDEHCLHLNASSNGYFNDANCTLVYSFICQDPLTQVS
uniref:C-type lectin n=1 Tax=Eriocheir sinensis TaxID=95602 RepID=E5DRB9_ERISI|nr:C-type lectin [Eriocheir sinensis]